MKMPVPAVEIPSRNGLLGLAAAARVYCEQGLSVIPVGQDKRPLVEWRNYQREPASIEQIEEWWSRWPDANIGTVTGAVSGLVVLDADGPEGIAALRALDTPATTWLSRTGRLDGGWQQFFRHPGVTINNRAGVRPHLDVRGDGGYVILPPSVHASGRQYEWLTSPADIALAPLPDDVRALLLAPPAPTNGASAPQNAGIPEGQRNATLYRRGRKLHALGLSPDAIRAALVEENAARCTPPLATDEVEQIAAQALGQADRPDFRSPTQTATGEHGPVLVRVADVAPEEVEWLWPGRLARGKPTLLVGNPGDGKSTLSLGMAASCSVGGSWPDGGHAPLGDVILLSAEDGAADTIRPRLEALGADLTRVHILRAVRDAQGERGFSLATDLLQLAQAIEQTTASVIVIDPLSAYLGGRDSYKDSEIRAVLTPLAALAEQQRVAVVAILHLTKDTQRRALYRALGSVGFVAAARIVLAVGPDPEDEQSRLLVPVKSNLSAPSATLRYRLIAACPRCRTHVDGEHCPTCHARATGSIRWLDPPDRAVTADAVLRDPDTKGDAEAVRGADEFLREILADGPVVSDAVHKAAKENGVSRRALFAAKRRLGVAARREGQPGKPGGRWAWSMPPVPVPPKRTAEESPKSTAPCGVILFEQPREKTDETAATSPKSINSQSPVLFGDASGTLRGRIVARLVADAPRWYTAGDLARLLDVPEPAVGDVLAAVIADHRENGRRDEPVICWRGAGSAATPYRYCAFPRLPSRNGDDA